MMLQILEPLRVLVDLAYESRELSINISVLKILESGQVPTGGLQPLINFDKVAGVGSAWFDGGGRVVY